MIIDPKDFHAKYGPGRPPIKAAYWDKTIRCDKEVPVLTALADHFQCRRCLEIGCNTGATSAAILAGNPFITEYIGVDLPKIWFVDEPAGHFAAHDARFNLMQLPNGSRDLKPGDIEPVDFIFIDADHVYVAVKHDTELARQLLAPSGVIVWHDYQHPNNPDVRKYIHEINDRPGEPPIVWVRGTTICYQLFETQNGKGKSHAGNEPRKKKGTPSTRRVLGS